MSLNSLDLAGVRLLNPRGSQILPKQLQVSRIPVQMTQLSSSGSSMKILFVVLLFSGRSVVEPSWDDQGSSSWVVFFYLGSVVGPMCVL